jgi:hypothetical protein
MDNFFKKIFLSRFKLILEEISFLSFEAKIFLSENISLLLKKRKKSVLKIN